MWKTYENALRSKESRPFPKMFAPIRGVWFSTFVPLYAARSPSLQPYDLPLILQVGLLEIRHLRAFVAVAHHLSLSRASQALFISQPALSRQIKDLEDELGVNLFNRHFNGMRLTTTGDAFYQRAQDIVDRTDEAVRQIAVTRTTPILRLSIGFDPWIPASILTRALAALAEAFPDVVVRLQEGTSAWLVHQLANDSLDLCLTVGDFNQRSRIDWSELGFVKVALYLDRKTVVERGDRLKEFLPLHTLILYQPVADVPDAEVGHSADLSKILGFRPGAFVRAASYATLTCMLAARQGFCIGPDHSPMLLASEEIVCLPLSTTESTVAAGATWRSGDLSPAAHYLKNTLRDLLSTAH